MKTLQEVTIAEAQVAIQEGRHVVDNGGDAWFVHGTGFTHTGAQTTYNKLPSRGQIYYVEAAKPCRAKGAMRTFEAYETAIQPLKHKEGHGHIPLAVAALGLTGEAGEVADLVKKNVWHGKPLERDDLVKELGDVLWYLSAVASMQGITLEEVAKANVEKLRKRYPGGFVEGGGVR